MQDDPTHFYVSRIRRGKTAYNLDGMMLYDLLLSLAIFAALDVMTLNEAEGLKS